MHKVRINAIENQVDSATVQRPLTEALHVSNVAINYYELAPGDSFAFGYHAHERQEEVFLIQEGTVTFETEDGDVEVEAGEAIRFGPGEFQQGINTGDNRVVAFVLGAPRETGESTLFCPCENCGDRTHHTIERGESEAVTRCLECDSVTARYE